MHKDAELFLHPEGDAYSLKQIKTIFILNNRIFPNNKKTDVFSVETNENTSVFSFNFLGLYQFFIFKSRRIVIRRAIYTVERDFSASIVAEKSQTLKTYPRDNIM